MYPCRAIATATPFSIPCPPSSSVIKATSHSFPCVPPVVSFAGTITGPGHSLLRQDLLPGKVAGLLDHHVMVHPPGFQRDYVIIVVPDSWTFLDKTTTPTTQPVLPLSTPPKRQISSATSAFQDMRAACYSPATPSPLPPSPPTSSSGQPDTPPLKRHYPDHAQTPTKRQRVLQPVPTLSSSPDSCSTVTQSFPASASTSSSSEPNTTRQGPASVNLSTPALDSIVALPSDSPNRPHRSRQPTKKILEKEYNNMNNSQLQYSHEENKPRPY
ncbi:hypothetical protein B0J15DRAFT_568398 [Fusarium solani]|uniref:Uncharacterized protein n=1 Tax=Fusarium solani TaxID=169388 RepID=A0A9P9GJV0_FUSSL|nr:uncharacterized protein B0J15DRAFT_568398 [Fusarium solani]KAH7240466.1 hypothetical protein B0J15DRAFT_568398 [Fusarium solani]